LNLLNLLNLLSLSDLLKKHIPNCLSAIRLLVVLPFVVGIYTVYTANYPANWHNVLIILLFSCIIVSDVLDGFLARKWQSATVWGAKLDIIADASYIIATLTIFAYLYITPAWFVVVMLAKCAEFILTSKIMNSLEKSQKSQKSPNKPRVAVFDKIGKTAVSAVMLLPSVFLLRNILDYRLIMTVFVYLLTVALVISFLHRVGKIIQLKKGLRGLQ